MDGIARWNAARATATVSSTPSPLRSFNVKLKNSFNNLNKEILGKPYDGNFRSPSNYTGELFGIEYLYAEKGPGSSFTGGGKSMEEAIDLAVKADKADKGVISDDNPAAVDDFDPEMEVAYTGFMNEIELESEEEEEEEQQRGSGASDSLSRPGWGFVAALANYLVENVTLAVTDAQANQIIHLYGQLIDYDKEPLTYEPTEKSSRLKPSNSRFHMSKGGSNDLGGMGYGGVRNLRRDFLGGHTPSHSPKKSRIVEAICTILFNKILREQHHPYISRSDRILITYNGIKVGVMDCPKLKTDTTRLALYDISGTLFTKW